MLKGRVNITRHLPSKFELVIYVSGDIRAYGAKFKEKIAQTKERSQVAWERTPV